MATPPPLDQAGTHAPMRAYVDVSADQGRRIGEFWTNSDRCNYFGSRRYLQRPGVHIVVTVNPATAISLGDAGHQGDFGELFVVTLAIAAGLDASKTLSRDRRGVDWVLHFPGRHGRTRYPSIEVQVKSWSRSSSHDDAWHYPLRVSNFNQLAGDNFAVPRFLFLVMVPNEACEWTKVTHESFALSHAAYWQNFLYEDPLSGKPSESTHTVLVPKAHLVTVESIYDLFSEEFLMRRPG